MTSALSAAMVTSEHDPNAEKCPLHVQQAPVGGYGGWHHEYVALVCSTADQHELGHKLEAGELTVDEVSCQLVELGLKVAKYSTMAAAVQASLKGGWDTSAAATIKRGAGGAKARSDPRARNTRKLCEDLTCQRDAVNGSHKKCGLCAYLAYLYTQAQSPQARTDIRNLQRCHASKLKRDRVAEKMNWTRPLQDKTVLFMCGDGASKELGGVPSSHRRRNPGKYNSVVLGHQATWKTFVVDLVTGYGSATLLFLLAPWLAPNGNTVLEVWHRVKVWMAEQGYEAGSTLIRQSDGGSDMWYKAAVAMAAVEIADQNGSTNRIEMNRLMPGHSHNQTDGSISVVSRALNGDRHGTSGGQWTLTATALARILRKVEYRGRATAVMFVHNAHDCGPTLAAAPRAATLAGLMSVHKLRFDPTKVSGEVGLTVFKHLSSDFLDNQPIVGREGCHINALQLISGGAAGAGVVSDRSRATHGIPLPTKFALHDDAGLSKARDGYATVATILKNPPAFGCSVPRCGPARLTHAGRRRGQSWRPRWRGCRRTGAAQPRSPASRRSSTRCLRNQRGWSGPPQRTTTGSTMRSPPPPRLPRWKRPTTGSCHSESCQNL